MFSKFQISLDHIEVNDYLIEIDYWITNKKEKESVLFKTQEFERWLLKQRKVSMNHYWEHWDPEAIDSWGSKIIYGDIKQYFCYKLGLGESGKEELSLSQTSKKPMKKVSKDKSSDKGTKTA